MQIEIKWLQRVNGRRAGDTETVERTPYIEALIAQRRVEIVAAPQAPILAVFVADPVHPSEPVTAEADDLDRHEVSDRPKPRPRKIKVVEVQDGSV